MREVVDKVRRLLDAVTRGASWLPQLLVRVVVGVVFLVMARRSDGAMAAVYLVCGALLVVGLLSRVAAIPPAVSMVAALATGKAGEIPNFAAVFATVEFTYFVMLSIVALLGPGVVSVDHLVVAWTRLRKEERAALARIRG